MEVCGACTVLLDGEPISSCTTLSVDIDQHEITTIEGVVINRLKSRGLIKSSKDPLDPRRREIDLTEKGRRIAGAAIETIGEISGETFAPLTRDEFRTLPKS
ncbi:hypothetical protein SAMN05216338_1019131 [Bradyrhizobium sp. Rc2d]|nr:hypothetical protein SAMN05216338_1019131 [Bradyrhizobium sp. Rc2d]